MKRINTEFSLRPATDSDIEFIFDLRVKTMKPFFMDTYGWSDTEELNKAADELNHARIVMIGHKESGVIKIIPRPHELHLHQMQILPEFQKKGIGEVLVRELIIQSEKTLMPITLYVIKNTPAKRLYDRSDFIVTDEYHHHFRMFRFPK